MDTIDFAVTKGLILIGAHLGLLLACVISSVAMRRWRFRWIIWCVTGLASLPLLASVALAIVFWEGQPPSIDALGREFPRKRTDLETILSMSNADSDFARIAPDFLWRNASNVSVAGDFTYPDRKSGLSLARWDEYRRVYRHSGVKLGILRDKWGDAFIMVDSIGLLNRGHVSGYLFCGPVDDLDPERFEPCTLHQDQGERKFDPNLRQEAFQFKRLDGRWFAFDQGPS